MLGQGGFWLRQLYLGCHISRSHVLLFCGQDMHREITQICPVAWEQWRASNNRKRQLQSRENNEPTHKLYAKQSSKCLGAYKINYFDKMNIILVTYPEKTEEHRRTNVCDEADFLTVYILTVLCMAELDTWQWKHA